MFNSLDEEEEDQPEFIKPIIAAPPMGAVFASRLSKGIV